MSEPDKTETAVRRFVRETLGCTCPDEVFSHIAVTSDSDRFDIANTVYEIGGRLLVAVIVPADWHELETNLARLVEAGRRFRDGHGYNRFRLVIAADDEAAAVRLRSLFDALPDTDDKTHLHVIAPRLLPRHGCAETL